jgi:hypothetical protein
MLLSFLITQVLVIVQNSEHCTMKNEVSREACYCWAYEYGTSAIEIYLLFHILYRQFLEQ